MYSFLPAFFHDFWVQFAFGAALVVSLIFVIGVAAQSTPSPKEEAFGSFMGWVMVICGGFWFCLAIDALRQLLSS